MDARAPRPDRSITRSGDGIARVIVTLAGVGGFLGLLLAGAQARAAQDALRFAALAWFLGFGVVRIVLDVRASRRRRDAISTFDR
jgi:hypothetical protein